MSIRSTLARPQKHPLAGIALIKQGNCFTDVSHPAALAKIAETLSEQRTIGRLSRLCDRWIYSACLSFALDLEEQRSSGFRYQYSNYQIEYSRNLVFEVGGHMEQVFQAPIDRSRVLLDPEDRQDDPRRQASSEISLAQEACGRVEVAVERPSYFPAQKSGG